MPHMQTAILLAIAIFTAAPPLTDKQAMQLQSAIDNSPLVDEAAWYPLLHNALEWQGDVKPGSKIPDYDAIQKTPSVYRGQRFILAGRYAGRPLSRTDLKVTNLARAGPWDGELEQWSMIVANDPEIVAIVYLVDPPDEPRVGSHIEIVARFYKIWETTNLANQVSRYPVFVGKSAKLSKTAYSTPTQTSRFFLALVIALGLGWLILRFGVMKQKQRGPVSSRHHVVPAHELRPQDHANDDDQHGLPQDPAQALLEIKRRQRK